MFTLFDRPSQIVLSNDRLNIISQNIDQVFLAKTKTHHLIIMCFNSKSPFRRFTDQRPFSKTIINPQLPDLFSPFDRTHLSFLDDVKTVPDIPFIHYILSFLKSLNDQLSSNRRFLVLCEIHHYLHMVQKLNIILEIVVRNFFNRLFERHPIQSPIVGLSFRLDRSRTWRIVQQCKFSKRVSSLQIFLMCIIYDHTHLSTL